MRTSCRHRIALLTRVAANLRAQVSLVEPGVSSRLFLERLLAYVEDVMATLRRRRRQEIAREAQPWKHVAKPKPVPVRLPAPVPVRRPADRPVRLPYSFRAAA